MWKEIGEPDPRRFEVGLRWVSRVKTREKGQELWRMAATRRDF